MKGAGGGGEAARGEAQGSSIGQTRMQALTSSGSAGAAPSSKGRNPP